MDNYFHLEETCREGGKSQHFLSVLNDQTEGSHGDRFGFDTV
jgi:hypothetical protein